MGLKGAGAYFTQKMAIEVLGTLLYRIPEIYMDDILLYAQTDEEYISNLRELFTTLREKKITVNPEKTFLGMSEVEYVGHTINKDLSLIHI